MHRQKAPAGDKTQNAGQEEKEERGEPGSFYVLHGLFDPEEPQKKKDQDENGRGLAPEFRLPQHVPNQMQA
jgi:hypothetical protein